MNDGYLIANPELLPSLNNASTSLLGNALRSFSVRLFCRNQPRDIAAGLQKSAENLDTHRNAISGKDGKVFMDQMEILQRYISTEAIQWPQDKNVSAIFAAFLELIHRGNAIELSLPTKQSKRDFETVYTRFIEEMDSNFNFARQRWEQLSWECISGINLTQQDLSQEQYKNFDGYNRVLNLMHVANEAYHMAYTAALDWVIQSKFKDGNKETRPLTAFCPAYFDFFEKQDYAHQPKTRLDGLGELLISFDSIKFGKYANYSWLQDFVFNNEVSQVKRDYLDKLQAYMNFKCSFKEALKSADEYRRQIARIIAPQVPTINDVAAEFLSVCGVPQVFSLLQSANNLSEQLVGIASPINLDPIKSVKQLVERKEVESLLKNPGVKAGYYGETNTFARNLGLINTELDSRVVSNLLEPIGPWTPN
ncbi:MAG: hypothetical protein ACSHYA_09490 [Opitutaceae bacterium]